jgi:osmotically-inducible protein OsmY
MKLFRIFSLLFLILSTSCVETVVVGSVAGGALAAREKSLKNTRKDVVIGADLLKEFVSKGLKNPGNSIDFTINEGRVLLTGIARDPEKAQLAQLIAWKVAGVKEVIDEIQVREGFNVKDPFIATYDYLITAQVEARMLVAGDVSSMNFKATTVGGVVYILGVAQNEFEMRRVTTIAAKVRGVTKVVNHVILENDSRRKS